MVSFELPYSVMVNNSCPNPPEPFREEPKPTTKWAGLLSGGHLLGQCTLHTLLSPIVATSSLPLGQVFTTNPCKIIVFVRLISRCQVAATSGTLSGDSTAAGTMSNFYRRWCGWGQALLPPHPVAEITLVVIRAVTVMWMRFKPGPRASMRFLCDYNKNLTHMVSC